jgi:hypothetical protein
MKALEDPPKKRRLDNFEQELRSHQIRNRKKKSWKDIRGEATLRLSRLATGCRTIHDDDDDGTMVINTAETKQLE